MQWGRKVISAKAFQEVLIEEMTFMIRCADRVHIASRDVQGSELREEHQRQRVTPDRKMWKNMTSRKGDLSVTGALEVRVEEVG
jgi:hypothetical protein